MTIKAKWDNYFEKHNMYSWIFVNGIMTILNEETYRVTIKENYIHRTPYYEISITNKNENKGETNEN
jgi:hypothetical protein